MEIKKFGNFEIWREPAADIASSGSAHSMVYTTPHGTSLQIYKINKEVEKRVFMANRICFMNIFDEGANVSYKVVAGEYLWLRIKFAGRRSNLRPRASR